MNGSERVCSIEPTTHKYIIQSLPPGIPIGPLCHSHQHLSYGTQSQTVDVVLIVVASANGHACEKQWAEKQQTVRT